jgi:hypothetical protein
MHYRLFVPTQTRIFYVIADNYMRLRVATCVDSTSLRVSVLINYEYMLQFCGAACLYFAVVMFPWTVVCRNLIRYLFLA